MTPYRFIILYGLPSAGKTTLAKSVAGPEVEYIRLDTDPRFRKETIKEIIRSRWVKNRHIITEGCFPQLDFRLGLMELANPSHYPICIYLESDLCQLERRQGAYRVSYLQLKQSMQITNSPPQHLVSDLKPLTDRITLLRKFLPPLNGTPDRDAILPE